VPDCLAKVGVAGSNPVVRSTRTPLTSENGYRGPSGVRSTNETKRRVSNSLAAVAVDVGFHDQAPLTRHFNPRVGTFAGQYRAR